MFFCDDTSSIGRIRRSVTLPLFVKWTTKSGKLSSYSEKTQAFELRGSGEENPLSLLPHDYCLFRADKSATGVEPEVPGGRPCTRGYRRLSRGYAVGSPDRRDPLQAQWHPHQRHRPHGKGYKA